MQIQGQTQGWTTDTNIRGYPRTDTDKRIRPDMAFSVFGRIRTDTDIEAYPYPFIRFIRIFCALDKMASTA